MLSPGTVIAGRYRLEELIHSGGIGYVWRGVDESQGRTVAVKIAEPTYLSEPGFMERFSDGARTLASINHPGIVRVFDHGGDELAGAYLVMESIEGRELWHTLAVEGRFTPDRSMDLVAQAADALHAAHDKGLIHSNVTPRNLLIRPDGTVVLTECGVVRTAYASPWVIGAGTYITPEEAMGEPITAQTDIYALGVVAYVCLAGHRPFEGDSPLEMAMRHVREAPPLPAPVVPADVWAVVERAMAKDPADRWPSGAAMAQAARQTR